MTRETVGGSVQFVLPECSDDPISDWLRALTEAICKAAWREPTGGFLGGAYGYGENFENEVFTMHRYCWCERGDCPWCRSCDCDGAEECTPECSSNIPEAPNFLHKPSGATVHWYKYIGRGMEVSEADWAAIFTECFASLDTTRAQGEGNG